MWGIPPVRARSRDKTSSVNLTISLADVYRNVNVPGQEPEEEEATSKDIDTSLYHSPPPAHP